MLRIGLVAIVVVVSAAPAVSAQDIDTLALSAHTRFLADDLLAGRGTGTHGERIAAAYIVSQLTRIGLRPAAGSSFLQPLPLRAARISDSSGVRVVTGTDTARFEARSDFIVNTGGADAFRDFRGGAVFMGQPIHAGALLADSRSMVGTVAVFLGPLGAFAEQIVPALTRAGAAGIILLVPDATQYDLYVRSRGDRRFFVDAPEVDDPVWQPPMPVLIAGPRMTDALLDGVVVPSALIEGTATNAVDLERDIIARIVAVIADVPAFNVAAVLPGSDPELRDEFVVYTAHYDHLGVSDADEHGDTIYNGFSDNAAGVAMLLAIAESMHAAPPARSVAFLFFTGEERGLLGSSYMAALPPFPLEDVAGLINLDAGAPPAAPVSWRIAGGSDSPIGDTAVRVAAGRGWSAVLSDASPNSDYWPFLKQGVPSVFIIPGNEWENTSATERDELRRRWDRYHMAGDHWHADFPFAGLARYAEFARLLGLELAAADGPG